MFSFVIICGVTDIVDVCFRITLCLAVNVTAENNTMYKFQTEMLRWQGILRTKNPAFKNRWKGTE